MPRFAANLTWMFNEHGFLDRFQAAADAGFKAVEIQLPYEHAPDALASRREAAGVEQIMFNAPPGDMAGGEYGIACLPGREAEFRASMDQALEYAGALGCRMVHVLAGIVPDGESAERCWKTYLENVDWAAAHCSPAGVGLLLEPINAVERPGYLVSLTTQARDAVDAIGSEHVGIQYDFHNAQLMEGRLTRTLEANIGKIRHMQVAGLPDRTPPDEGEMNFSYLFALVDRLGYEGWIGCEYRPRGGTLESLGWAAPYGIG
ncbi:MAG: 2-oxo-tetronate isomerase [Gammaproteobacteria bacterium]|nr:2-oxo-tetronate isomerase [Gammaproteobacteria bacterium]